MALLRPLVILLLGTTALQLGLQSADTCNEALGLTRAASARRFEKRREEAELVNVIAKFPGPVVSTNMMALLQAGKPIPFEPAIIALTTETGVFDETSLVQKTSDRFFDAFVMDTWGSWGWFSPRMVEAIRQNYRPYAFNHGDYFIYVRK